jgi:hypothetical protein
MSSLDPANISLPTVGYLPWQTQAFPTASSATLTAMFTAVVAMG